jgi:hypothetical protein
MQQLQLQQFHTLSQPSSPCEWGQFINIDYVEEYPHIKKRTPLTHTHNPYSTYAIDTKVNCKKCTKYLRGTGCVCKYTRTIYNFKSHIYQQNQNKNQTKMNELEIKEQPIKEQPEETKQDIYVIDIIDNNKDIEYENEDDDDEKYIKEKITYMFSMIAFIVLVLVI